MTLLSHPRIVAGNRIVLLKNGAEFFPALTGAIDNATTDIRLETYIFRNDVAGIGIADALKRSAQRGVKVQVLIDGVGSHTTPWAFFADMQNTGIEVLVFRPEKQFFNFKKSRLRRVHRKIALIDGKVGFVGGINLIDDMTDCLAEHPRYDYAVQVEGPVLADIHLRWCICGGWFPGGKSGDAVTPFRYRVRYRKFRCTRRATRKSTSPFATIFVIAATSNKRILTPSTTPDAKFSSPVRISCRADIFAVR